MGDPHENDGPNAAGVGAEPPRRPRKGDELEVEVERLGPRGVGLAQFGEHTVHVRGVVPGARARVRVTKRRRTRIEARVVDVLDPGPWAVPPRCDYTGLCGGCAFQTLDYGRQLVELERLIHDTLAGAGLLAEARVEPIVGCAEPFGYRNKMDFTFGARRWVRTEEPEGVDASFALGLHVAGVFQKVLDIASCAIHFEEADALLADVRSLARARGLSPWDLAAHEGLLRHLVLRKGVRTGEIMVDLVTSARAADAIDPLVAELVARHPEITTVVQNVTTRLSTVAVGEEEHCLFGPGVIRDELCGSTFTISANSFFQTNTVQAERLFEIVREEAGLTGDEVVHDLYCGAGTIGIALADRAREVWGFESAPSAIADARRNAIDNDIRHAHFVEGDVLASLAATSERAAPDVVVVDPPRAGLHPKVPPAIVASAPRRIVYVSCNVTSAAHDLPALLQGGYRLTRVRPIDLFPHTPHVECVFTLERAP